MISMTTSTIISSLQGQRMTCSTSCPSSHLAEQQCQPTFMVMSSGCVQYAANNDIRLVNSECVRKEPRLWWHDTPSNLRCCHVARQESRNLLYEYADRPIGAIIYPQMSSRYFPKPSRTKINLKKLDGIYLLELRSSLMLHSTGPPRPSDGVPSGSTHDKTMANVSLRLCTASLSSARLPEASRQHAAVMVA